MKSKMSTSIEDWSRIIFGGESKFDVCAVTISNESFTKKRGKRFT